MESLPRVKWRFKNLIVIFVIVLIGVGYIAVSLYLKSQVNPESEPVSSGWTTFLNQLGVAMLVGCALGFIYEIMLRQDFVRLNDEGHRMIMERLDLADQKDELGLIAISEDAYKFDFESMILGSSELTIVLNDGRTWVTRNSESLRRRFADANKTTVVFLLHPESAMLEVQAKKVDSTSQKLGDKINETIGMLKDLRTEKTNLKVYGHMLFNPYATFLSDKSAVITLYFTARGRTIVPTLEFRDKGDQGFVKRLREDIQSLYSSATELSLS